MTHNSVEDELAAEARKFSAAMRAAIQRHAQAANWFERRRARKEISRLVREERRDQGKIRGHHLSGANHAVDRYRIHAQAVAQRANDPRVDHEHRARDARALAQHRDGLAKQFVTDPYLTRTEQGIVLDGLDAATIFPEFPTGNLFSRAHKVKGTEALRYRARVAREVVSINQSAQRERQEWQQGLDAARRATAEDAVLARIDAAQSHQQRYLAQMSWTEPDGGMGTLTRAFPTERAATEWMQRSVHGASWSEGTTLSVETRDMHNAAGQYFDWGRPETVAEGLAAREAELRERTLAGLVHREQILAQREAQARGQSTQPEQAVGLRFTGRMSYLPEGANQVVHEYAAHASEAETADWAQRQVAAARPAPGTTVQVAAVADEGTRHSVPLFRAVGRREEVAEEVTQWRVDIANVAADREQDTDRGGLVKQALAERDQLRGELDSLTKRHQLSIEHNGELTDRTAKLERQLTAMIAERDQAIADRDAAVRKVAEMTPAQDRYGSPERQAAQARDKARADRTAKSTNGQEWANAEETAADFDRMHEAEERGELHESWRETLGEGWVKEHRAQQAADERHRQRAATRAAATAETSHEQGGPSALAGYQQGSALAEAVTRNGAERNGTEHDGMDR